MKIEQKILSRILELIKLGDEILMSAKSTTSSHGGGVAFVTRNYKSPKITEKKKIEEIKSIQWKTSCEHLLQTVFGNTHHYNNYCDFTNRAKYLTYENVARGIGVLNAAKDDYENGYLFDTRILIEAEVFDDFLEQAEELFKKDYYAPAAVIAGCVLEDGLRKLCDRKSITLSAKATIDPMNVELAKAGIYNKLIQKKITALADLRNKAAHGEWTEFAEKDVEDMIRDVRRFMEDYFS